MLTKQTRLNIPTICARTTSRLYTINMYIYNILYIYILYMFGAHVWLEVLRKPTKVVLFWAQAKAAKILLRCVVSFSGALKFYCVSGEFNPSEFSFGATVNKWTIGLAPSLVKSNIPVKRWLLHMAKDAWKYSKWFCSNHPVWTPMVGQIITTDLVQHRPCSTNHHVDQHVPFPFVGPGMSWTKKLKHALYSSQTFCLPTISHAESNLQVKAFDFFKTCQNQGIIASARRKAGQARTAMEGLSMAKLLHDMAARCLKLKLQKPLRVRSSWRPWKWMVW